MDTFTPRKNDEAMEAGLELVRRQGFEQLQREQAERAENERRMYAEIDAQRAAAENQAIEILRKLGPLYVARSELVKALVPICEQLFSIETQTRAKLNDASALVEPHWRGRMPDNQRSVKFAELRNAAGLPDFHASFGLPATRTAGEKLAATVAIALAREMIAPDVITVSGKSKQFDSSAGF